MKKKKIIIISSVIIVFAVAIALYFIFAKDNEKTSKPKNELTQEEKIKYHGEEVTFKKYRVNQEFILKIPELFVEMSDDEVNRRYTNQFKPGLIFTNDEMDVELFVHAASDALTNETLRAFVDNYKTTVGGAEFTTDEIVTVQNKSVAKLNYTIQNDTTKELHHVLFFSMNDKATMVDFKYPSERSKEWDAICSYTLKSLEFTK